MRRSADAVLVLLSVAFAMPGSAWSQDIGASQPEDPVSARLEMSPDDGSVRGSIRATLILEVRRGWKLYARESEEIGLPLVVHWQVPDGWEIGAEHWPRPRRQSVSGLEAWVYEGRVVIERELFPNEASAADSVVVDVEWAACAEVCVRGTSEVRASPADWLRRQSLPGPPRPGARFPRSRVSDG